MRPAVTISEAVTSALVVAFATIILTAYVFDQGGTIFGPPRMALIGAAAASATLWWLWPRGHQTPTTVVPWLALVGGTFAWLMWLASPSFLPLGTGPDLTHHLQLIRYIDEHWHLVRGPGLERALGEMAFYTPGSHILASLAGAWTGTSGLHALQPVLSLIAALKLGLVALIARRMLPEATPRDVLSVAIALAAFASHAFLLGAFLQFAFVAQVVAELFAVFAWWTLVVFYEDGRQRWMVLFGLSCAALFLTWPVLVGPPLVLLGFVVLWPRESTTLLSRMRVGLLGAALPVLIGTWFIAGRAGWLQMAGTGGSAHVPTVAAYGSVFLIASTIGLPLSLTRERTRVTGLMAAAILLQAAALWWVATRQHNSPYMAQKMFYLLLLVQTAGLAAVVGEAWRGLSMWRWSRLVAYAAAGAAVVLVVVSVSGGLKRLHIRITPAITTPLEQAGEWARGHVPGACVEYLVSDDEAAYWLHLAVLGNPRLSSRTADFDTYELTPALVRWLTPNGLPYAIVELPAIPDGIRDELDILSTFETAAVARRRGPSSCEPQ